MLQIITHRQTMSAGQKRLNSLREMQSVTVSYSTLQRILCADVPLRNCSLTHSTAILYGSLKLFVAYSDIFCIILFAAYTV